MAQSWWRGVVGAALRHQDSRDRCAAGLRDLALEFGPAELVDSAVVRPLAMYAGPLVVGSLAAGVVLGKVAADVVFYGLAVVGYELARAPVGAGGTRSDPRQVTGVGANVGEHE